MASNLGKTRVLPATCTPAPPGLAQFGPEVCLASWLRWVPPQAEFVHVLTAQRLLVHGCPRPAMCLPDARGARALCTAPPLEVARYVAGLNDMWHALLDCLSGIGGEVGTSAEDAQPSHPSRTTAFLGALAFNQQRAWHRYLANAVSSNLPHVLVGPGKCKGTGSIDAPPVMEVKPPIARGALRLGLGT